MANNPFNLHWFEIRLTRDPAVDFSERAPRYVVFAFGVWSYHMMDWRGCNFWEKKISKGVKPFLSIDAAKAWIKEQVQAGVFKDGMTIEGGYWAKEKNPRDLPGNDGTVHFRNLYTEEECVKLHPNAAYGRKSK